MSRPVVNPGSKYAVAVRVDQIIMSFSVDLISRNRRGGRSIHIPLIHIPFRYGILGMGGGEPAAGENFGILKVPNPLKTIIS